MKLLWPHLPNVQYLKLNLLNYDDKPSFDELSQQLCDSQYTKVGGRGLVTLCLMFPDYKHALRRASKLSLLITAVLQQHSHSLERFILKHPGGEFLIIPKPTTSAANNSNFLQCDSISHCSFHVCRILQKMLCKMKERFQMGKVLFSSKNCHLHKLKQQHAWPLTTQLVTPPSMTSATLTWVLWNQTTTTSLKDSQRMLNKVPTITQGWYTTGFLLPGRSVYSTIGMYQHRISEILMHCWHQCTKRSY